MTKLTTDYQKGFEAGKKAALEWQPIETAPKDGTTIILCGELKTNKPYASKRVFIARYTPRFTQECGEEEFDKEHFEFKPDDEDGTPYSLEGWVELSYHHDEYYGFCIDLEETKLLGWLPLSVLPKAPEVKDVD